jgi:hypothetical protein
MSLSVSLHSYYSSGNHPAFSGVRSKICRNKMSEHIVEAGLGGGRASSSSSKMTGQGEGIYASATSADVGLQQTDQIGLTLPPKTKSGDKLSLEDCMIIHQDFEDALKQLEPLLAEDEERTPSFLLDPIYGARRRYVAALNKRRRLSGDLYELLFQRPSSSPVIQPRSVSFPTWSPREATEQFLQPTLSTVSPKPIKVCAENQHHNDGNDIQCHKPSEFPLSAPDESPEGIGACQEDPRHAPQSAHENVESVEEINLESRAFKSSRHASTRGCGISTTGSNCAISGKDPKGQGRVVQNGHDSEMSNYGVCHGKSADITNIRQGKVYWDPDVPLQSLEKENQELGANSHTDMRSSRSRSFDKAAESGVSIGFLSAPSQTIAGVAKVTANETTRKFEPSQDSLQSSRKSLQTPTLASIARLILQSSQQASVEGYSELLSSHQIPAELRKHFHALLSKFQSDDEFQSAVATYIMELTGKLQSSGVTSCNTNRVVGAVPPAKSDSCSLPLKLRQVLDALVRKHATNEDFKMSVDKFVMEYLSKLQSSKFPSNVTKDALGDKTINEDFSSVAMELDGNQLYEKFHRKDLGGLSMDQLTKYCRELELSRAYFAKELRAAKDHARKATPREKAKHRQPRHKPAQPNPNPGTWTCFHPQTTRQGNKAEPCGNSNPHYEARVLWVAVTNCKTCKGPYHKDFELQKLKTPRKKYNKPKAKSGETATPDAHQSPANAQTNDFRASSIMHQDPLIGASSGQMCGYLAEDDQDDACHLSPGWHSDNGGLQHTPVSDRFHSTPMDGPFSCGPSSTADRYSMQSPGFQDSNIGYMDALNLNKDFTGQNEEFDEFAINSDPLFMDMDTDLDLQQAGSFPEQTHIFQEDLPQFPQNHSQLSGHYPAQVNLFTQELGSHTHTHSLSSLLHPLSTIDCHIYGTGSVSVSSQNEYSRSLESTRLGQVNKPYQSPYSPISPSILPQSTNLGTVRPAGTLLSFPESDGIVPLNSAAAAWPPEVTSSAGLHTNLQESALHPIALPNIQTSLSASHLTDIMTQTGLSFIITDPGPEGLVTGGQTGTSSPSFPWSSRPGPKTRPIPNPSKFKTGRGLGCRAATNAESSPTKKKRTPQKPPSLSRAKAAVTERAALKAAGSKTSEPETPLTESQMNQVHISNNTSAMFLGGPRKSWQEPIASYPPKVIIEIPDDEATVEEAEDEEASQVPQGAVADQDASNALDEALLAEFNAEFDRQDRAAALGVLDEHSDADGVGAEDENDEMSGDDESRRSNRVIAVAAAQAAAEESEESEEE